MSEWIKVSNRLPGEGKDVLVFEKYRTIETIKIGHRNGKEAEYWVDDHCYPVDKVIAWMELPEPPKNELG